MIGGDVISPKIMIKLKNLGGRDISRIKLPQYQELNYRLKPDKGEASFKLTVKRFYTNMVGLIQDKNTVASNLQVPFPVYLFNTFDFQGGYFLAQKNQPSSRNVDFWYADIYGSYFDQFSASGLNNVKNNIKSGDVIILYTNDINAPNTLIWIVISGEQQAYGSVLLNPLVQGLDICKIGYFAQNEIQLTNLIQIITETYIGTEKTDSLEPLTYRQIYDKQVGYVEMGVKFNINNYTGINLDMNFETDLLTFIFKYYKPEVL